MGVSAIAEETSAAPLKLLAASLRHSAEAQFMLTIGKRTEQKIKTNKKRKNENETKSNEDTKEERTWHSDRII